MRDLYVKYIFAMLYKYVVYDFYANAIRLLYVTTAIRPLLFVPGYAFAAGMTDESKYSTYF
jgi:hypothetical protein